MLTSNIGDVLIRGEDERGPFQHEILVALALEALDVHQLAADLAASRFVVADELDLLVESGLIEAVLVGSGRSGWSLTARGRERLGA